jgi:hypothetical protein
MLQRLDYDMNSMDFMLSVHGELTASCCLSMQHCKHSTQEPTETMVQPYYGGLCGARSEL